MMVKINETHIALKQGKPIRLQEYGLGIFPTLSTKSALKKALKKGLIYVNGQVASTATIINGGELISLQQTIEIGKKREFKLPTEVIFEDEYLAVINKPAGVLVSGNAFKTVSNALAQNLQESDQIDAINPKPVHRLDFPTTGVLLIGKTSSSVVALSELFKTKEIAKTYYAITIGKMEKEKSITSPIDGKQAASTYKLINTIVSKRFGYLNLIKLCPKTGRRHQLRKHLAAIENPILGDDTYGTEGMILKGKGLYLHAFSLEFIHPFTKEKMYFEKELPSKFKKLFP